MNINNFTKIVISFLIVSMLSFCATTKDFSSEETNEINTKVDEALTALYAESPAAKKLGEDAFGVLVFPNITKAGLGVGGEYGEGVLRVKGKSTGHYSTTTASVGLQVGISKRSQVVMFLEQAALDNFTASQGWEAGVDANIAVMDVGMTIEGSTTSIKDPIVAFIFGEKGLMAGISLEGSKYTRIDN